LSNVTFSATSYFPESVKAGYYTCAAEYGNEIIMRMCCQRIPITFQTGILTSSGELSFNFMHSEDEALPFAKALQNTVARRNTRIKYATVSGGGTSYTDAEKKNLPLMSDETLLDRIEGFKEPVSCCGVDTWIGRMCVPVLKQNQVMKGDYLCSRENMGRNWFPCLPKLCTCGYSPLQLKKDMVVTEYSLISYVRKTRECTCSSLCKKDHDFGVVWVTNDMLVGQTLSIGADGFENFTTRCFKSTICGRVCCPIGTSSWKLAVKMDKNLTFNVGYEDVNAQWLKDATVLKNLKVVDNVQAGIYEASIAANQPVPAMAVVEMEKRSEE